jgi:hypothetical protein
MKLTVNFVNFDPNAFAMKILNKGICPISSMNRTKIFQRKWLKKWKRKLEGGYIRSG